VRAYCNRAGRDDLLTTIDMDAARAAYDDVYAYSMGRTGFVLQYVVDPFAVQAANDDSGGTIGFVFGLVGLYLHVAKNTSGRQVQKVHMMLGRRKRGWPRMHLPKDLGSFTLADALAASAGAERDAAIENWCRCVWAAFSGNRETIIALLREYKFRLVVTKALNRASQPDRPATRASSFAFEEREVDGISHGLVAGVVRM
jgi:hypothetical protein